MRKKTLILLFVSTFLFLFIIPFFYQGSSVLASCTNKGACDTHGQDSNGCGGWAGYDPFGIFPSSECCLRCNAWEKPEVNYSGKCPGSNMWWNETICLCNCDNDCVDSYCKSQGYLTGHCDNSGNPVCENLCGNGVCEAGECSSGCTDDCAIGDCCGNGTCDTLIGENASNCFSDCSNPSPTCGNGVIDTGEECDPGPPENLNGKSCTDFNSYTGGILHCNQNCTFDKSGCTSTGSQGLQIPNPLSPTNDIPTLLEHIISFLFTLSLILGPVFIVIGALYLLISGGDINKVQRGKNIILYTVIGMAIIILAKVFVSLIRSIIIG